MIPTELTREERQELLGIARRSIEQAVNGRAGIPLHLHDYSSNLQAHGASFVTLTISGGLRGCIGTLEAYQPLIMDVQEHAIAAATEDYRFPPVSPREVSFLRIEISRLTQPESLLYSSPNELPQKLRPGIDGVVLRDGLRRATFLPQVWDQLPDPAEFLNHLCSKMGAPTGLWRQKVLDVRVYQVEEFSEDEFAQPTIDH